MNGQGALKKLPQRKVARCRVQSNFNGSNIFETIENCSRHGWFEPLRVNHGTSSGSK